MRAAAMVGPASAALATSPTITAMAPRSPVPHEPIPVTAIVPLKALDRAKGRLAGDLDGPSRQRLSQWMFGRVARALHAARTVTGVLVVVGDADGAALATAHGFAALREPRPGLQAALGAADAATAGAPATLVVAADLPLARGGDLDAVCAAGDAHQVVVAPTRDGGTGALYRRPAAVIRTAYGPGSARAHLDAAAAGGVRALRLEVAGLALDVDTAAALREAVRRDSELAGFATGLSRAGGTDWPLPGSAA